MHAKFIRIVNKDAIEKFALTITRGFFPTLLERVLVKEVCLYAWDKKDYVFAKIIFSTNREPFKLKIFVADGEIAFAKFIFEGREVCINNPQYRIAEESFEEEEPPDESLG